MIYLCQPMPRRKQRHSPRRGGQSEEACRMFGVKLRAWCKWELQGWVPRGKWAPLSSGKHICASMRYPRFNLLPDCGYVPQRLTADRSLRLGLRWWNGHGPSIGFDSAIAQPPVRCGELRCVNLCRQVSAVLCNSGVGKGVVLGADF